MEPHRAHIAQRGRHRPADAPRHHRHQRQMAANLEPFGQIQLLPRQMRLDQSADQLVFFVAQEGQVDQLRHHVVAALDRPLGRDQDEGIARQRVLQHTLGHRARTGRNRQVQLLVGDVLKDLVAGGCDQLEFAVRQAVGQNRHQSRRQVVVEIVNQPDAQRAEMRQIHHRQLALRQSQLRQRRFGPPQKAVARRGQAHGPFAVVDQIGGQCGFQIAQLLADRGLA